MSFTSSSVLRASGRKAGVTSAALGDGAAAPGSRETPRCAPGSCSQGEFVNSGSSHCFWGKKPVFPAICHLQVMCSF